MDKENIGQEETGQTREETLKQAKSIFEKQRDEISEGLSSIARVFQHSAHQLQQQDKVIMARCIDGVAGKIEQTSDYFSRKEAEQIVDDIKSFARNRPWLFLGSAVALGFFSVRLLKSSR